MALSPGTRLGPYEVIALIGVGGMGEVYRATDAKLKRHVAFKILPPAVATDGHRLARFRREAELLASLNHPNIAGIYGFEESGGTTALVMELVEGEDLSQRLARGAIPITEAIPIAKQIADALEAAHEQGIIHRDLKPANVKVRDDGTVKVLDFGLAKALEPAYAQSASAGQALSMSPTITSPAMTEMGMILGTAAYMSPEQAKGRPVDRRSDVWAFGCVLYEMLTGRRAFPGDDVSDTLAAILKTEPRWEALPGETPEAIRRLLRRCLAKERRERLGDVTAVRLELVDAGTAETADASRAQRDRSRSRAGVVALAAVAVAGAAVASTATWFLRAPSPPAAMAHLTLDMPSGLEWRGNAGSGVALSPDGRFVAYIASASTADNSGAQSGVYVRPLDRNEAVRIPGTDRAYQPFFSPDSREIGYLNEGKIWRAPVTGGTPLQIGPVDDAARGAAWGADGFVYLGGEAGLTRTPVAGGQSESLTRADRAKGEVAHRFPEPLPGGRAVVFNSLRAGLEESRLALLDLATRQVRTLFDQSAYSGRYVAGRLLFMRAGVLMAAPFDVGRAELTGPAVPILNDVAFNNGGAAHVSVSATGTLVFVPGREDVTTTPVWVDRSGNAAPVGLPVGAYTDITISPDGRRIALVRPAETAGSDIVVWDVERRVLVAATRDAPAGNGQPVWMPDSQTVVFSARPKGVGSPAYLFRVDARGSARPERVTRQDVVAKFGSAGQYAASVSSDGMTVYFAQVATDADGIYAWRAATSDVERILEGDSTARPLVSPDGKWIAYVDSGSVWVRSVGDGAARPSVVAPAGFARWSADSRELFVRSRTSLAAFAIDPRTGAANVRPLRLFDTAENLLGPFDVARDGRFLMLRADTPPVALPHVILNWPTLLAR